MKSFGHFWIQLGMCLIFSMPFSMADASPDAMPADRAFQLSAKLQSDHEVMLHIKIAPQHYLYQKKIKITIKKPKKVSVGQIGWPKATVQKNVAQGQPIYQGDIKLHLPVLNWQSDDLVVEVHYQGCSAQGYCYPPTHQTFTFQSPSAPKPNAALAWLARQPIWLIPFGFLGFGLLLSLTPCTFPMIPILSSIILGYREHLTMPKAFLLSLIYVVSMASVYALLGVVAGLLGSNLQMAFQTPTVVLIFSSLFVFLAFLSFTGAFHLRLPAWVEQPLRKLSQRQKGGSYIGVAIMGALSTLIVSPCVTPPLIGVISYISQTGQTSLAAMALFFMGLGMGVPLLLIGTLEARWLPKSGPWMRTIELILGFLLLGIAIDLLSKILPTHFILSLWGGWILMIAFYLGRFFSPEPIRGKMLRRGLSVALIIYGGALMVGGLMGNEDFFAPLKKSTEQAKKTEFGLQVVTSLQDVQALLEEAKKKHQPVFIDFYADWCVYCKSMEKKLFQDPEVMEKIKDFKKIKVDLTQVNDETKALLKYFDVIAPPAILFFDRSGKESVEARLLGEVEKDEFLQQVKAFKGNGHR